jgi:hypothetical protein
LKFKLTIFNIQTKFVRISFKLPKYIAGYCSSIVATTVTLGVSQ